MKWRAWGCRFTKDVFIWLLYLLLVDTSSPCMENGKLAKTLTFILFDSDASVICASGEAMHVGGGLSLGMEQST